MDRVWSVAQKELAKSLFGRALRMALAEWILDRDDAPFFTLEAQQAMVPLGEAASGVAKELSVFVAARMLQRVEDGRRVYYQRVDTPLWPAFRAISEAVRTVHQNESPEPRAHR